MLETSDPGGARRLELLARIARIATDELDLRPMLQRVTDTLAAREFAESLCARLRDLALPHAASPVAPIVTASVGVAASTPRQTEPPARLIEAADAALYAAKRAGRNRVVTAAE